MNTHMTAPEWEWRPDGSKWNDIERILLAISEAIAVLELIETKMDRLLAEIEVPK